MYWKKLKLLGRGSYGTVSLATPLTDYYTLFAAVKSAEDDRSSSLREEAQILHALRGSDYVVKCFGEDVSIENGKKTYNLLLEYAAGGTLHDLIHKSKTVLGESEAAYYAFQILVGICHVHRKRFIHCDLKPANILVFPGGQHGLANVKLADFGLSLRSEINTCWDTSLKKRRRRRRGTLLYAAPESVVCGIQDKAVDIWAFGCILVEMLTGKRVWSECKNKNELKLKIAHEKPEIPDNISNDAKDFLSKCLDRDHRRWNAEMLLNHSFITNYVNKKMIHELIHGPLGDAGLKTLVSLEHLFTTTSFYYPHNSYLRGSSSNITTFPETNNNNNARGRTEDGPLLWMNFRDLHL